MRLSGLHLLLTYTCCYECAHCFVWGSPYQSGTMRLRDVENILEQAKELGTIKWIFFEGGEPFLYHPILVRGAQRAADLGFSVGFVSNAYWAEDAADARLWLEPFAGVLSILSLSCDAYHGAEESTRRSEIARAAAERLSIPVGVISIPEPETADGPPSGGASAAGGPAVMYRGRAAEKLADQAVQYSWEQFTECPHEDLREPGRVHVDPLGNVHICQGISLGNMFRVPLRTICESYDPEAHPITGALLRGGPAELARSHGLSHREQYADACHLCDEARRALRCRFPNVLMPDQMYGVSS